MIQTIRTSSALSSDFHYRGKNLFGAFLFTAIPALAYWARTAILPQPERYHLEMEMAVCLDAAMLARHLVMRMGPAVRIIVKLTVAVLSCGRVSPTPGTREL